MLREFPYFVKCQYDECGVFFKIDNSVVSRKKPRLDKIPPVRFLSIDEYSQGINVGLFNSGKKGSDEWESDILALRMALWRSFNHRIKKKDFDEIIADMKANGASDTSIFLETFEFEYYRQFGQYNWFKIKMSKITQDDISIYVIDGMKDVDNVEKAIYDDNCREIISLLENKSDDESILARAELYRNIGKYDMCKNSLELISETDKYKDFIKAINAACDIKSTLTLLVERDY